VERGGGSRWPSFAGWGLAAAAHAAEEALALGGVYGYGDHTRIYGVQGVWTPQKENEMQARVRNVDDARATCLKDLESVKVSLREKELALELLSEPATMLVRLDAQDKRPYRASAILNRKRNEAVLISSALTPQPGKDYQPG
jgi:hypothetical protein